MDTNWLDKDEVIAWVRLASVMELLPGVLDRQLRRDSHLMHYEYFVLAMLSEAPQQTLPMTSLAARTFATRARLSHVVHRLENQHLIERVPCPRDARVTNARLTATGWDKVREAAPGHVDTVRRTVFDALTTRQVRQLADITEAILGRLDPEGAMSTATYLADRARRRIV